MAEASTRAGETAVVGGEVVGGEVVGGEVVGGEVVGGEVVVGAPKGGTVVVVVEVVVPGEAVAAVVGPASAGLVGKPLARQPAGTEAAISTTTSRCVFTRRSYGERGTRTRKALARTLTESERPGAMMSPSSSRHSSASDVTSMRAPW
jgi:hypothetical protein